MSSMIILYTKLEAESTLMISEASCFNARDDIVLCVIKQKKPKCL